MAARNVGERKGIADGSAYAAASYECSSKAGAMGMSHQWGPMKGCLVKTPRGWFPIEAVRDEQ